ncbi:MAG: YIP1 family protein, partial [Rhodobacteraceae bacterium]|nr:YIP1 family protein [Paracoccaceae bacterium]
MTALTQLLRLTLLDPRAAARVVIGLNLPLATAWTALALTTVLAAILSHLTITLMGG